MTPSVQAAEVDAPTFVGASQSLSLDVVRQKIEEAVAFTRKVEADRYESGIRNLNDQLNSAKNHLEELVNQLRTKEDELAVFKFKVSELEKTIRLKEESGGRIRVLEEKLDKLYNKISDGSISPLVGSKMDKPTLEDRIFIDPLEKGAGEELEAHIEVKEEKVMEIDRDVSSDLAKLRSLLKLREEV
jgi:septal ring factor EnvC (AmiA/AmiB activator)